MSPQNELVIPISDAPELVRKLWQQNKLPVVYRPRQGKLAVKLPYREDNQIWLKGGGSRRPKWHPEGKYWETPAAWYERVVRQSMVRFGGTYTIRPVQDLSKCAPACWNALGPDCHCSCEGENHGKGTGGRRWNVINESLAVEWGPERLRCTLLLPTGAAPLGDEPVVAPAKPAGLISDYAS
jgi:hypothetical protein